MSNQFKKTNMLIIAVLGAKPNLIKMREILKLLGESRESDLLAVLPEEALQTDYRRVLKSALDISGLESKKQFIKDLMEEAVEFEFEIPDNLGDSREFPCTGCSDCDYLLCAHHPTRRSNG